MPLIKAHQDIDRVGDDPAQQKGGGGSRRQGSQVAEGSPIVDRQIQDKQGDSAPEPKFPFLIHSDLRDHDKLGGLGRLTGPPSC